MQTFTTDMYPALALLFVFLVVGVLTKLPALKSLIPPESDRISAIDGLRGFLAMGVVLSHYMSWRYYDASRYWGWPPGHLFRFSGEAAVALFFCITGFLFWSKSIKDKGVPRPTLFYKRRFLRIYPLYLAVVCVSVFICLVYPNGRKLLLPQDLFSIGKLLVPGSGLWREVKGVNTGLFLTQSWTLIYEFAFYALLPLLGLMARSAKASAMMLLMFAVLLSTSAITKVYFVQIGLFSLFFVGIIAAEIRARASWTRFLAGNLGSVLMVAGLAALYLMPSTETPLAIPALLLFFLPLSHGNTFFGLLRLRLCRVLGDISYSIYMTHMVVLFLFFSVVTRSVHLMNLMLWQFWALAAIPLTGVVCLSFVTYRFFEAPFLLSGPRAHSRPHSGAVS